MNISEAEGNTQDTQKAQQKLASSLPEPSIPASPIDGVEEPFIEGDAGDGTVRSQHILTGTKLYICIFAVGVTLFLLALDQNITASLLTTISDQFDAFDKMEWMSAAFLMSLGAFSQMWGALSISFGRKWTVVAGILIFELGSLICAVSQNMNTFIAGRAVQGCGGSAIQTIVMLICTEVTKMEDRPLIFGLITIVFVLSSFIGPLVGGALATYASWRWCFYINLMAAAVALPLFIWVYRPPPPKGTLKEKLGKVDFMNNFLMVAAILLTLLGISFGETGTTYRTASVICCFVLGGVLAILFFVENYFSKNPSLPLNVIGNRNILMAFGTMTFSYAALMVAIQFLSIYFQNIEGHNAFHTGIAVIPIALTGTISSLFTAGITRKTLLLKPLSIFSSTTLCVGIGLLTTLSLRQHLGCDIGYQILVAISGGTNFQVPLMNALIEAPKTPAGTLMTSAFMNSGRSILSALFIEIGGAIYTSSLKSQLVTAAKSLDDTSFSLSNIVQHIGLLTELDSHDQKLVKTAYATCFGWTWHWLVSQ